MVDGEGEKAGGGRKGRKMEVVVGYIGTGYIGLQMQADDRESLAVADELETESLAVADELETALYRWGGIKQVNYRPYRRTSSQTFNYTIRWNYASRTDKGVHAAYNIIGTKLLVNTSDLESNAGHLSPASIAEINSFLPNSVRVLDAYRVTQRANARTWAESRRYVYMLPLGRIGGNIDKLRDTLNLFVGTHKFINFAGVIPKSNTRPGRRKIRSNWTEARNEREKETIEMFKKLNKGDWKVIPPEKRKESRYTRTIVSIKVQPYKDKEGRSFALITLHGKSFVLHQIRKIIGSAIAVVNGDLDVGVVKTALKSLFNVYMPLAPGDMLVLDSVNPRPDEETVSKPAAAAGIRTRIALEKTDGRWDVERDEEIAVETRNRAEFFRDTVILPHVSELALLNDTWRVFDDEIKDMKRRHMCYDVLREKQELWDEYQTRMFALRRQAGMLSLKDKIQNDKQQRQAQIDSKREEKERKSNYFRARARNAVGAGTIDHKDDQDNNVWTQMKSVIQWIRTLTTNTR